MTIYSQHANRGKVQVLATYHGPVGVTSATVTSVDDVLLAEPIVDALNRISAYATMPVSLWDERARRIRSYPREHLAALTDPDARGSLLEGAHSLWYEQVKVLLHDALTDLDAAVAAVPAPVKTAIAAELEAEAAGLREALAEFSEGVAPPEVENRRIWEFGDPFVVVGNLAPGLDREERDRLNSVEEGITQAQLEQGANDLRLLLAALIQCANNEARLLIDGFEISDDPWVDGPDRYFLNVQAPMPNGRWGHDDWKVEICRWVLDDPEDEESSAEGVPVLDCVRSEAPELSEIVELLNRSGGRPEVLAVWAKTAIGQVLAGTAFTVTKRYED